jgi:hypothetical protein
VDERTAAILAAVGFLVIAIFQAALALGAPLGRAAWGGTHPGRLPGKLRGGSAVAVVVWLVAAFVVLDAGGVISTFLPAGFVDVAAWVLAGFLVVGTLMNAASRSGWERFGWAPVSAILAVLCVIVARG